MISLDLTMEQYRALIELVYLGRTVANDGREDPIPEYDQVEQLVNAHAKEAGLGEVITDDEEPGVFLPTAEFEEGELADLLAEYDNDAFWRELPDRLAERDLVSRHGRPAVDGMSDVTYEREIKEIREKYEAEFRDHGVDRLRLPD